MPAMGFEDYKSFLHHYHTKKGQEYTHTSIASPKTSLYVSDEDYHEFMEHYKSFMVKGTALYLTEKPKDPGPMRVDLDFRFVLPEEKKKELPRMYTEYHIENILRHYFQTIYQYLDVPEESQMIAYVMEKPNPVEFKGKIKDGLHFVFPYLIVPNAFQHFIRRKILDEAPKVLEGIPCTNLADNIIDEAIIDKNNWQMYGSTKPDCKPYRVTRTYQWGEGGKLQKLPNLSANDELELTSLLSMRKGGEVLHYRIEKCEEIDEYTRVILPMTLNRRKDKLHQQIFGNTINLTRAHVTDEELEMVKKLVECLSKTRAENYEDWIKVGWTLRNIDNRLLTSWIEFSQVSTKYISGECEKLWDKMRVDTLGVGSLHFWAKHDNPIKYREISDTNIVTLIDRALQSKGAHFDVARVVHAMYKHQYRFTSRDIWYLFREDKHRWVRSKEGLQLRMILSMEVCQKFMERATYWNIQAMQNMGDEERSGDYIKKRDQLLDITNKLKSSGYKDSIMKECKAQFCDERFDELLDSHPHLIGFENGVYDLRLHEFREGIPDDYISFSTGRNYIPYNPNSPEIKEIETFLSQVFTNPAICKYVKDIFSSTLDGGIRHEKFYIFTGSGCHAIDTPIMMYDGTIKKVQDVQVGERLMGDDHTPRVVQELFRGNSKMYRIIPVKGEPFVVNEDHKLSLKITLSARPRITTTSTNYRVKWLERIFYTPEDGSIVIAKEKTAIDMETATKYLEEIKEKETTLQFGDVIDVQVKNYLKFNMFNLNTYLFKTDVEFEEKPQEIDPYLLGYWLGDGLSAGSAITTMEQEVVDEFKKKLPECSFAVYGNDNGKAKTYGISCKTGPNRFLKGLQKYSLIRNKHIPHEFKTGSREQRLQLLAGLIDSDGNYQKTSNQFTITQKNKSLMEDIQYLVRSLGFAGYMLPFEATCKNGRNGPVTNTYYRINIYGTGIEKIPCRVPRKQAMERVKAKDALLNKFKIEYAGNDDYYGFQVDSNHRYMMGDFTVTSNSNGKSKILELIQRAVGEYYCILPISLLTQKRVASNSAQSELERTRGRRFSVMQEPSEGEKINIGLMKELSGGDRIMVRGLYKEPIEFKPQFKMIMTCNELPEVPSDDGGTWRRIRVVDFTSKFMESPDPKNPREFKVDTELGDKFERWADPFMSLLIENHKMTDLRLFQEPMEVRISTESYKKNNDVIGQYVEEKITKDTTDHSTERLQLQSAFSDFRVWCVQNAPKGKKIPDRNQFRAYLEKIYGAYPSDGKGWRGVHYVNCDNVPGDVE